jgi:hypothetical protein
MFVFGGDPSPWFMKNVFVGIFEIFCAPGFALFPTSPTDGGLPAVFVISFDNNLLNWFSIRSVLSYSVVVSPEGFLSL